MAKQGRIDTVGIKVDILIVENDESVVEMMRHSFKADTERYQLKIVGNLKESRLAIRESRPDLIIASYLLPDGWGIEFLSSKEERSRLPMILLVNPGDEQMGLKAIKSGALDYVIKSEENISEISRVVERALQVWHSVELHRQAEEDIRVSLKERKRF